MIKYKNMFKYLTLKYYRELKQSKLINREVLDRLNYIKNNKVKSLKVCFTRLNMFDIKQEFKHYIITFKGNYKKVNFIKLDKDIVFASINDCKGDYVKNVIKGNYLIFMQNLNKKEYRGTIILKNNKG